MEKFVLFGTQHLIILISGIVISMILLMFGVFIDKKHFARFTALIILIIKIVEL